MFCIMDKESLLALVLSPLICDPVRYLVSLEEFNESGYEELYPFNEPTNSSQIHFTLAAIEQFGFYDTSLKHAAAKSPRWKFLFENYVKYRRVFSTFDRAERLRAETEYLRVQPFDSESRLSA